MTNFPHLFVPSFAVAMISTSVLYDSTSVVYDSTSLLYDSTMPSLNEVQHLKPSRGRATNLSLLQSIYSSSHHGIIIYLGQTVAQQPIERMSTHAQKRSAQAGRERYFRTAMNEVHKTRDRNPRRVATKSDAIVRARFTGFEPSEHDAKVRNLFTAVGGTLSELKF